jgi:hypothetical protein
MNMIRKAESAVLAIARVSAITLTLGQGCATDHDEAVIDEPAGSSAGAAPQAPSTPAASDESTPPIPLRELPEGPFRRPARELRCGEQAYEVAGYSSTLDQADDLAIVKLVPTSPG